MENIGLRANKMQSCNCFRRFDLSRLRWAQSPLGFLNRSSALWRRNFSKSIYFYFMFLLLVGFCPYNSHTQIMERASSWWQFKPWADFFKPLSKINWHILGVIHSLHAILFIVLPLYNHKRSHLSQFAIAVREVERKNHTQTKWHSIWMRLSNVYFNFCSQLIYCCEMKSCAERKWCALTSHPPRVFKLAEFRSRRSYARAWCCYNI